MSYTNIDRLILLGTMTAVIFLGVFACDLSRRITKMEKVMSRWCTDGSTIGSRLDLMAIDLDRIENRVKIGSCSCGKQGQQP